MEKPSLDTAKAGAMRFNTDSSQMEIYDGNQWTGILATSPELQTGGTRGMQFAGEAPTFHNTFFNIATTGDAIDFGDSTNNAGGTGPMSSSTRALFAAGYGSPAFLSEIASFEIATTGNAVDFGDISYAADNICGLSNGHGGL